MACKFSHTKIYFKWNEDEGVKGRINRKDIKLVKSCNAICAFSEELLVLSLFASPFYHRF